MAIHRLQYCVYKCPRGDENYRALQLPEPIPYGEFLMRSESGVYLALMNALEDPVFLQVNSSVPRSSKWSVRRRADVVQAIFAHTCDPAPDGSDYVVDGDVKCPRCGVVAVHWQRVYEFTDVELPVITHVRWLSYSVSGRQDRMIGYLLQMS